MHTRWILIFYELQRMTTGQGLIAGQL